jgi:hypothetical protein
MTRFVERLETHHTAALNAGAQPLDDSWFSVLEVVIGGSVLDCFIPVKFTDGSQGKMVPAALDLCLRQNRIRSFRRAEGWVVVGIDPIRGTGGLTVYTGPERRVKSSAREAQIDTVVVKGTPSS